MNRVIFFLLPFVCTSPATAQQNQAGLQLTLPPYVYAATDVPISIYFDNVVLTKSPGDYRYEVECNIGSCVDQRWTASPTEQDTGDHSLQLSVYAENNELLESKSCVLRVASTRDQSNAPPIRLLIIGDSLTHASQYPNEVAKLLMKNGSRNWKMLGTHKPSGANERVAHEGYGGWTWARFVTKHEPNPDGTHRKRSSPFVFLNEESKPELDMHRYFVEDNHDELPTHVVIMLGINDCFSAPPDDIAGIDARVGTMLTYADRLLAAIVDAAPDAQVGFCITTPPNARQEAFHANYKNQYTRWGWKRIQHRLLQRQLQYVEAKADPKISIVPTQLNLDPVAGYPENNGVHPNAFGYQQIGASLFAWLCR